MMAGTRQDSPVSLVRRRHFADDLQPDAANADVARKPTPSLVQTLFSGLHFTLNRLRSHGWCSIAAPCLCIFGALILQSGARQTFSARLFGSRHLSVIPPDVLVTVYSYDRPADLLRLLGDIDLALTASTLTSAVHVLDDNSLGCIPSKPPAANFFDLEDDEPARRLSHANSLSITQLTGSVTGPTAIESFENAPVSCAARSRFRDVEFFMRAREGRSWRLFVSHYRHGRRRLWHLAGIAHRLAWRVSGEKDGVSGTQYFIFLPDDVRLSREFIARATAAWNGIEDERKMTLMLHIEQSRRQVSVWTDFEPQKVSEELVRIGWVESGNFICGREMLRFFDWSFPRIPLRRWVDNPPISSGVGAKMSGDIHGAGRRMFRTEKSLVAHVGVSLSKMNAEFRQRGVEAHETVGFIDGDDVYRQFLREGATVSVSLASKWDREVALHAAVSSLAPQVDHIFLYLNGYEAVPSFARVPYITAVLSSQSPRGDMGDVGKFFWANDLRTEFHATADDDIVYPSDYIKRMLAEHAKHTYPVVIGAHGINIKPEANTILKSSGRTNSLLRRKGYYANRDVFMGIGLVEKVESVHILGTGTVVYRVEDFGEFDIDEHFPERNMADIWFAKRAQLLRVPLKTLVHGEGWLKELPGTFSNSIFAVHSKAKGDLLQTRAVVSMIPWQHYPATSIQESKCESK